MQLLAVDWSMPANTNLEPVIKRFKRYLEDNGIRESTIKLYTGNAERYLRFVGTDKPIPKDWEDFRASLHDKKLSRSTLNQYSYAVRAYHAMLGEKIEIKRLEPNNQIPYYFDKEDIIGIFDVCRNLKHYAMLSVLFYACLRAFELCNLDDKDVDLRTLTLRVREGKGGKDGLVPISSACANILKQYLKIRPQLSINNRQPLFYTDYGKRWDRTEIYRLFMNYKKKAGIEKQGGVHVFARHSAAALMLSNGADVRLVQEILRHSDIRTTLRYCHLADKKTREMYEQFLKL